MLYLLVALLVVHEMDAVGRAEWRMFKGLSALPESTAYAIFGAIHVPLFAMLMYGLFSTAGEVRFWISAVLDGFLVIHVLLHLFFLRHRYNQFTTCYSWAVIVALGTVAAVHLAMISA